MHKHKYNSGFSLVETMIVVAIVGIVMGFAVPSFSELMVGRRVESATQRIANVLNRAVDEARARREAVTLSWGSSMQGALTIATADRELHVEDAGSTSVTVNAVTSVAKQIELGYKGLPSDGNNSVITICEPLNSTEQASRMLTLRRAASIVVQDTSGAGTC